MPNLEIFNDAQKYIIELGMKAGIDTSLYTKTFKYSVISSHIYDDDNMPKEAMNVHEKPVFSEEEMYQIYLGLIEGVNVTHYTTTIYEVIYSTHVSVIPFFNAEQMKQIRLGLKANIDVSLYTSRKRIDDKYRPVYDAKQMEQIRLGLIDNLLVKLYADPRNDSDRMNIFRQMLMFNNLAPIRQYSEFLTVENGYVPLYDNQRLLQILLGMAANIDFIIYDSFSYDVEQMEQIRLGLMENLDVSQYANPNIPAEEMLIKRQSLKEVVPKH